MRYQRRFSTFLFGLFAFVITISVVSLPAQQSPEAPAPEDQEAPQVQQSPDAPPAANRQLPGYSIDDQEPAAPQYSPRRPQSDELAPRALESLRESASSKTEFTLDHSMLVIASKIDSENEDLRRVIAGVSGVSIHRFHFPGPGMYDPAALKWMKHDYQAAGWKQLVNNHEKGGGPGSTGLWVRFDNNAISDVAILLAKSDSVNFIVISGSMSPMDLIHLGGHFGIPKMHGGVVVPNNKPHS
jgi:hypothetical protein